MSSTLETTWAALAEPNRRAALELLRVRPRTVGEVAEVLGLAQPTASKHLKVLREAGLVRVSADAQRRIYAIDPAPLVGLDAWLAPYRAMWNERLDALGRHLDEKYAVHKQSGQDHFDRNRRDRNDFDLEETGEGKAGP